ncbi:hypothetical protein EKO23_18125, partial [Nocardioides guangzhouensis]
RQRASRNQGPGPWSPLLREPRPARTARPARCTGPSARRRRRPGPPARPAGRRPPRPRPGP